MFVRLAVILLCSVAATFTAAAVYIRVVLPELHRRRIERLESENERLDKLINPKRRR